MENLLATVNENFLGGLKVCNDETFIWTIKNVIDISVPGDINLNSATFEMDSSFESRWKFSLEKDVDILRLSIYATSSVRSFLASFSICLLDKKMIRKYEKRTQLIHITSTRKLSFEAFLLLPELLQHVETLFHNGDLILLGTITIFHTEVKIPLYKIPEAKSNYTQNMRSLMEYVTFLDFTVVIEEKEYPCHKAVLASRSQYFHSLLRCDMKEKRENLLVLEDIVPSVFEQVLMYIYTEEVDISKSNVIPLLTAADKYMLYGLKQKCQGKLFEYFNGCNLPVLSAIADLYHLHDLGLTSHQMYAMFTMCRRRSNQHDALESSEPHSEEDQISCKNYALEHKSFDSKLHNMKPDACLPSATKWIATYNSIILQCSWNILSKDVTNRKTDRTEDSKFLIINEKFELSGELDYQFLQVSDGRRGFKTCFKLYFKLISFSEKSARFRFRIEIHPGNKNIFDKTLKDICVVCELDKDLCIYEIDSDGFLDLDRKDFTISCRGWLEEYSVYHLPRTDATNYLVNDLTAAYNNALLSDLTIKVKETNFECHKAILSCRSRFLARKIKEDCVNGELKLPDVDPDSFRKILSYIYSDDYEMTATEARDVLPLACQFELDHLKSLCENCLARDLTAENAVETLHLSISYSALALQKCSLRFVRMFLHKILQIPGSSRKIDDYKMTKIIFSNLEENASDENASQVVNSEIVEPR